MFSYLDISNISYPILRPPNNDYFQIRSVQIVLRHQQPAKVEGSGQCVYWNTTDLKWSASGCSSVHSNLTHTVCKCNHLTHFAILMDVNAVSQNLNPFEEWISDLPPSIVYQYNWITYIYGLIYIQYLYLGF